MARKQMKTEYLLLALAAGMLCLLLVQGRAAPAAEWTGYAVSTARGGGENVTPEPLPPVDVNTAGGEELQTLRGIGPVLAERIIAYREEHGPFGSLEELLEVKGIGPATLDGLRDYAAALPPAEKETKQAEEKAA